MASGLFDNFKENCLTQATALDFDTALIKARLVNLTTDNSTLSYSTWDFLDDTTQYNGTTDQTLSNKTMTDGTFDNTATITFSSVNIDGAKDAEAVIIYYDTTVASTSPLICCLEFASAVTPNGGDIVVDWHTNGLFAL